MSFIIPNNNTLCVYLPTGIPSLPSSQSVPYHSSMGMPSVSTFPDSVTYHSPWEYLLYLSLQILSPTIPDGNAFCIHLFRFCDLPFPFFIYLSIFCHPLFPIGILFFYLPLHILSPTIPHRSALCIFRMPFPVCHSVEK